MMFWGRQSDKSDKSGKVVRLSDITFLFPPEQEKKLRRGDTNPIHKLQKRKTNTTLYSVILRNTNSIFFNSKKEKQKTNELRENRNQPTHQTHLFIVDNRDQIRQVRQVGQIRTSQTNQNKSDK
jgi:hypothetical protein